MSEIVFHMRSRVGNVTYLLRPREIEIYAGSRSRKLEVVHQLTNLSPIFSRRDVSLRGAWLTFLALFLGCVYVTWRVAVSDTAWAFMVSWPALFAILFLWLLIRYLPKMKRIEFVDHAGNGVFGMVQEEHQHDECAAFLERIVEYIHYAERRENPPKSIETPFSSVKYFGEEAKTNPRGQLWVYSLIASFFATGVWMFRWFAPEYDGALFMLWFLVVVPALLLSYYSISRHENSRKWSFFSIILVIGNIVGSVLMNQNLP